MFASILLSLVLWRVADQQERTLFCTIQLTISLCLLGLLFVAVTSYQVLCWLLCVICLYLHMTDPNVAVTTRMTLQDLVLRTLPIWLTVLVLLLTRIPAIPLKRVLQR